MTIPGQSFEYFLHRELERRYGAGQPSAVVVDDMVYLFFTDTTAPGGNPVNGGGVFVVRSHDPEFGGAVEELTGPGVWTARSSTRELVLNHKAYEAFSVDCMFLSQENANSDQLLLSVHGTVGKSSVVVLDRELRQISSPRNLDNVPWTEGPAIVRTALGHSLPLNRDGSLPWNVIYSTGLPKKENMESWNLALSRFNVLQ